MPRFISLLRFTDKGARELRKSTNRAHAFDKAAKKVGVTVEAQYWTIGRYDGALIINAPSEIKALKLLAALCGDGNVRSETMLALKDSEFDAVAR
ncbi:MAG: GYD domain-containing protein [Limisphaerales bacterium]